MSGGRTMWNSEQFSTDMLTHCQKNYISTYYQYKKTINTYTSQQLGEMR